MGLASGKLTLHPVQDKTETNDAGSHKPGTTVETASQLVNGDASVLSNVPAIDDEQAVSEKPVGEARTEVIETVDEVPGPNGTVTAGEGTDAHESERKKSKNPLGWIKRRLSKKTSKAEPTETGDSPNEDKPEESAGPVLTSTKAQAPPVPEAQVNETAESLVNEVLSCAIEEEQVKHEPETPSHNLPSPQSEGLQMPTQHEESHAEPTNVVEETKPVEASPIVSEPVEDKPAHEEHHEELPGEELNVLDTNNTNVATDNEPCDESDLVTPAGGEDPHHQAVFSKMAELDLTNGHPEEHTPAEYVHEAEHGEVMINGN